MQLSQGPCCLVTAFPSNIYSDRNHENLQDQSSHFLSRTSPEVHCLPDHQRKSPKRATTHHRPSDEAPIVTEVRSRRPYVWCNRGVGRSRTKDRNRDAMGIKLTQHVDLPPVYICPTCLKPTPFQIGEHWQVCEEQHFAEVRAVTFANGEARQVSVQVEKPDQEWRKPVTDFGNVTE
jgi:hypothetical protein